MSISLRHSIYIKAHWMILSILDIMNSDNYLQKTDKRVQLILVLNKKSIHLTPTFEYRERFWFHCKPPILDTEPNLRRKMRSSIAHNSVQNCLLGMCIYDQRKNVWNYVIQNLNTNRESKTEKFGVKNFISGDFFF